MHRAARDLETIQCDAIRNGDTEDSPLVLMGVQPIVSKDGEATYFMITFNTLGHT